MKTSKCHCSIIVRGRDYWSQIISPSCDINLSHSGPKNLWIHLLTDVVLVLQGIFATYIVWHWQNYHPPHSVSSWLWNWVYCSYNGSEGPQTVWFLNLEDESILHYCKNFRMCSTIKDQKDASVVIFFFFSVLKSRWILESYLVNHNQMVAPTLTELLDILPEQKNLYKVDDRTILNPHLSKKLSMAI